MKASKEINLLIEFVFAELDVIGEFSEIWVILDYLKTPVSNFSLG